jgi:hypothetical protein
MGSNLRTSNQFNIDITSKVHPIEKSWREYPPTPPLPVVAVIATGLNTRVRNKNASTTTIMSELPNAMLPLITESISP